MKHTNSRVTWMSDETNADGELLAQRFEVGARLGRGAQGVTHVGVDRETGEDVVIKELDVGRVSDWKSIELFEREGEALASLNHPNIPGYVDAFHVEEEGRQRFFLVQERVRGESLASRIDAGVRVTEGEVRDMASQLLEIAGYIHNLNPPVVHRDIKPSNIIRGEDGTLWLVDFGAVQTLVPESTGGSTVVGTTGYMPVEQLMGRATGAADLYAIGATLVHLLGHVHPADIEVAFMKLQFKEHVDVSPALEELLEGLLEPHVENRIPTARAALDLLEGRGSLAAGARPRSEEPAKRGGVFAEAAEALSELDAVAKSHIRSKATWQAPFHDGSPPELPRVTALEVSSAPDSVNVRIPKLGWSKVPLTRFALIWNVVVVLLFVISVLIRRVTPLLIMVWMILTVVGVLVALRAMKSATTSYELAMTPDSLVIGAEGVRGKRDTTVSRDEIDYVDFRNVSTSGDTMVWEVRMRTAQGDFQFLNNAPRRDQLFVASTLRDWVAGDLFLGDGRGVSFDFESTQDSTERGQKAPQAIETKEQNTT